MMMRTKLHEWTLSRAVAQVAASLQQALATDRAVLLHGPNGPTELPAGTIEQVVMERSRHLPVSGLPGYQSIMMTVELRSSQARGEETPTWIVAVVEDPPRTGARTTVALHRFVEADLRSAISCYVGECLANGMLDLSL